MPPKSWAFFQPRGPDTKSGAGGEIEALVARWNEGESSGGGDPQVANKLADLYVGAGRLKEAVRYYEFAMRSYLERGLFAQALAIGGKAESRCQGEIGLELYKLLVTAAVKKGVGPDLEARVTAFFSLAAAEQKMPLALDHTLQQLDEAEAGTPRLDLTLARWQLSLQDPTSAALRLYRRSYAYRRRGQEADADELYRTARETAPSLKPPEDTQAPSDDGLGKSAIPWLVFNAEDVGPSSTPNAPSLLSPRVRTPAERPAAPSPALEPRPEAADLAVAPEVAEGFQTFEPAQVDQLPPAFEAPPLDELLGEVAADAPEDDERPSLEAVFGRTTTSPDVTLPAGTPPSGDVAVFLDLGSSSGTMDDASDTTDAEAAPDVATDLGAADFSFPELGSATGQSSDTPSPAAAVSAPSADTPPAAPPSTPRPSAERPTPPPAASVDPATDGVLPDWLMGTSTPKAQPTRVVSQNTHIPATEEEGKEHFRDLVSEFRAAVEPTVGATDFGARYNFGQTYRDMDLLDEAIEEFRRSAESPDVVMRLASVEAMGECLLDARRPADALRELEGVLPSIDELSADDPLYLGLAYLAGMAAELLKDPARARIYYTYVVNVDDAFRDAQHRLTELGA